MLVHILCFVNIGLCVCDVPSRKWFVCVHSTFFRCTVWKEICFCALYTFLTYLLESFMFLYTVNICVLLWWKCSLSVHSTHFWCNVWKVFCFCAHYICLFQVTLVIVFCFCVQYTFMSYPLEWVLLVCAVHISDVPSGKCFISVHISHFWSPVMWYFFKLSNPLYRFKCFLVACTAWLWFHRGETFPINVETYKRSLFPYECDRYEIFVLHPH